MRWCGLIASVAIFGSALYDRSVDSDEQRRARSAVRQATATLRKLRLGDVVDDAPVSGAAAISLATRLTRAAYALAGTPVVAATNNRLIVRFVPREGA